MLSTFHLLTGAALAVKLPKMSIPNVFALAFVSHFVLDALPHWDFIIPPYTDTYLYAWGDMFIGWALVFWLLYATACKQKWKFVLCAGAAIVPDVINFFTINYLTGLHPWSDALMHFHIAIQWEEGVFWGLFWQFLLAFIMILIILKNKQV